MSMSNAFESFDSVWARAEYDLSVYRGDLEGDPDETAADRQGELASSLRDLADKAARLAAELDA